MTSNSRSRSTRRFDDWNIAGRRKRRPGGIARAPFCGPLRSGLGLGRSPGDARVDSAWGGTAKPSKRRTRRGRRVLAQAETTAALTKPVEAPTLANAAPRARAAELEGSLGLRPKAPDVSSLPPTKGRKPGRGRGARVGLCLPTGVASSTLSAAKAAALLSRSRLSSPAKAATGSKSRRSRRKRLASR
jgi:hypothetical protein